METRGIYKTASETFGPIAGAFVMDSLKQMTPWLITIFFVVLCDLIAGIRRSVLMKEPVRFSRAWRRTMGKAVTYFSFVVMVVMINIASGNSMKIDIYACLFVCFLELCSIVSNILKPKGYNLNFIAALSFLCKKAFKIDKEDVQSVITKSKQSNE